ncbi:MAG: hypothetical protein APR63_13870 [Desulfuromonas sp. SDB]|nr:MAG: hypothetical protein APR63_13870 [Desulfuromonas sp. SDB]
MEKTFWTVEETFEDRFPFRINIVKGYNVLLSLRTQARWPGQKGNVFCIREKRKVWNDQLVIIEKVPVTTLKKIGKRLVVVLDRAINKRCDFLFLKKKYHNSNREYEQIFWRTQTGLASRKPSAYVSPVVKSKLNILIDINEKYPWNFTGCSIKKIKLPAGDYALEFEDEIKAVVERKTFDNMLAEFGRMPVFQQQLSELDSYKYSALVVEANYSDFLNKKKLKFYSPFYCSRLLGEISASHPGLTIVFSGNRKLASQWCLMFFNSVNDKFANPSLWKVADVEKEYGDNKNNTGGRYYFIRNRILKGFPIKFTMKMITETFPEVNYSSLRKILKDLIDEDKIKSHRKGKNSYYEKIV